MASWFHIYPFRGINFHTKLIPESEPVFVNPLNGVIEYVCRLTTCGLVISYVAFFFLLKQVLAQTSCETNLPLSFASLVF